MMLGMIKQTIAELTTTAVANAMGLPISTVHRWKMEDRIPGEGPQHEWRVAQFNAAVKKLRSVKAKAAPKRRRAA
jgi:hypothetical protein